MRNLRLLNTPSGHPSAVHQPSGLLVHSRQNPVREATTITASLSLTANEVLLLGGGLGYLAEAIREVGCRSVFVLEPLAEMRQLAAELRPDSDYVNNSGIGCMDTAELMNETENRQLILSPYLPALLTAMNHPLSGFVSYMLSRDASRTVYQDYFEANLHVDEGIYSSLPAPQISSSREVAVIAAGPSLDAVIESLHSANEGLLKVAVSGAVPALTAAGLTPDWIVCMESAPAILEDLSFAHPLSKLLVLPSVHRDVVTHYHSRVYRGLLDKIELRDDGGTTLLPALDFALRLRSDRIYLLGADLSHNAGAYCRNSLRAVNDIQINEQAIPKYRAMRNSIESHLAFAAPSRGTAIHHVVPYQQDALLGTLWMSPKKFAEIEASVSQSAAELMK